jgi:hypothetical protein
MPRQIIKPIGQVTRHKNAIQTELLSLFAASRATQTRLAAIVRPRVAIDGSKSRSFMLVVGYLFPFFA